MATWMRQFVRKHPKYNFDSMISDEIAYDLAVASDDISRGKIGCPELFAVPDTKTSALVPEKCHKMEREMEMLVKKVTERQKVFAQPQVVQQHLDENGVAIGNGDVTSGNESLHFANGINANGINGNGINGTGIGNSE